jgi:hypothetical protein
MAVYHQIGHHSENLIREPFLDLFAGAILSPVNYSLAEIKGQLQEFSAREHFELIFDAQLYVPTSQRGQLRSWPYFPSDFDTADLGADSWWDSLSDKLAKTVAELGKVTVCSPAVLPRTYSDDYLQRCTRVGDSLREKVAATGQSVIQTAVVSLADLTDVDRPPRIASILSQSKADRIYLILLGATEPRRELGDSEELKGAMRLIHVLSECELQVIVGYSSSDILLWRHAGAAGCATGKFFNLRRFTPSRFEEPGGGGGQIPYWFEETFLAFLRASDLRRVQKAGLLSDASIRNPYCAEILRLFAAESGEAWLREAWRQFMWWFADADRRISAKELDVPRILKSAEEQWSAIEDKILMEEPRNNGTWIRQWRRACIEFLADEPSDV